jgi:hypothetical protein
MVKINGTKERKNMTKYVKIKDCVVGKKYRFEEHEHTVTSYDYNYSYMTGTCVTNQVYTDREKVFGEYEHLIEIKLDMIRPELEGEYDNKLMFYFPHDNELYNKVKVVEYE